MGRLVVGRLNELHTFCELTGRQLADFTFHKTYNTHFFTISLCLA